MRSLLMLILISVPVFAEKKISVFAEGLHEPFGLDFHDGKIYCTEFGGHRVVAFDREGKMSVIAGSGKAGNVDGTGPAASFNAPHNLVVAQDGTIYVADTMNHTIRRIDARTREVRTIAGTGKKGFGGDGGPAINAQFDQTYHVTLDSKETKLTITDLGNRRIRQIDLASGNVTTIAGNGTRGVPKDGTEAKESPLVDPRAHVIDPKGNLWILERGGHALRVVESGKIRTVAGTGQKGNSGDDGLALQAKMDGPKYLWIDPQGDVLIADTENHCIRVYRVASGKIERVAGTGKKGKGGLPHGPLQAELNRPHAAAVGPDGSMYISDSSNGRILKIEK